MIGRTRLWLAALKWAVLTFVECLRKVLKRAVLIFVGCSHTFISFLVQLWAFKFWIFVSCNIRICASWSDNPLDNGLMVKLVFLNLSIKMLLIAVDEQLLILVGKLRALYKSYDNNRESN